MAVGSPSPRLVGRGIDRAPVACVPPNSVISQSKGTAMTVKDLERLFEYGYWANRKLFDVIAKLSPEELTRQAGGSYGSVRNTLVHALSAEWGWLERCGGRPRGPALKADDYPTFESLRTKWAEVERYVREFLSTLKDEDLERVVEFALGELRSGKVGALMQHAANHGVHHRGQVALLLRMLGHAPGNFDLLFFDAEMARAATQEV